MSYIFICIQNLQKKYAGQIVDRFRLRWNNYKGSDKKFVRSEEIKQQILHEHFRNENHFN